MTPLESTGTALSTLLPGSLVHLCGIAGSAMSGLALILRQQGFAVQGTDPSAQTVQERLQRHGIAVFTEQDGRHLNERVRLVIATAAVEEEHPELRVARSLGLCVRRYAQVLGELSQSRDTLAVAGTHGKTTTSSMAIWILRSAGLDPGFVIGGTVLGLAQGAHHGTDPAFVAEACEYRRSFLELLPTRAIITNIEADHLDVYRDADEIEEAFSAFAARLGPTGLLLYSADCARASRVASAAGCRTVSFGFAAGAQLRAMDLEGTATGTAFTVLRNDEKIGRFCVNQPGRHNVANALAASGACADWGLPLREALGHLASFPGAHRRFEILGETRGVAVVDDYAHHPTELRALLEGARQRFAGRRLLCAFQPHQSSRTRLLLADFAAALGNADTALLVDIYSVRDSEADRQAVCAESLRDAIRAAGGRAETIGPLSQAHEAIASLTRSGDVVLCAGAGPMDSVARALLDALAR